MLKGNNGKVDIKSKLCYFVGYPKGTKGWLFYDPKEQIVFVRSMMSYSDLPKFLWGYALELATYILDSIQTKYVPNTRLGASLVYNTIEYENVWRMYLTERPKS